MERVRGLGQGGRRRITPVVLTVDEIQNLPEGKDGPPAQLLPILPVLGGLAWSEEHLDGLGISRLSGHGRVRTLAPLLKDDCREAVRLFFTGTGWSAKARRRPFGRTELPRTARVGRST